MEKGLEDDVCMEEDDCLYIDDLDKMEISIRGVVYEVDIHSLKIAPNSKLCKLGEKWSNHYLNHSGSNKRRAFYLNQNPAIFHCILDYYKTGKLHLPDGLCGHQLKRELSFWGLGENVIAPCCLWKVRDGIDTATKISSIQMMLESRDDFLQLSRLCWKTRLWSKFRYPFSSWEGIVSIQGFTNNNKTVV